MYSEYIHKGPRSRKKEEKKNAEGGENVDGMIAETTLVSCNHIAPIATRNDLDTVSVISADRSSTDSVRACNGHALAEGCAKLHEAGNELDFDHLEWNDSVVKVNGNVHRVHDHDIDVVSEVDNRTYKTCMLPKSKSSSAMSARSPVYSVVHKSDRSKARLKGTDEIDSRCKQTVRLDGSLSEQDGDITEVKKARSDIELTHFTNDETENRTADNAMHDIKSPSLRNLVQSFIGKIDTLSPKKEGDTNISKQKKEILDNDLDNAENELSELVPLLVDPDDSGLASAPSPHIKLQQETPAGPGSMFCPSCGQKQSDMSDISLESYDRTSSLRSYNSLRSDRLKSLSRNTGPVIQIIPKELALKENQNAYLTYTNDKSIKPLEKLLEAGLPSIAKQTLITNHNETSKVGYAAFSSFDTETSSVAPSTSVSNGSLESAVDDITSDQSAMETNSKHHNQTSDKSRNVAIYSLRQGKQHGKPLKEMSPEDSGIGASIKLDPNSEDVMDANFEITGRGFTDMRNNAGGYHPRKYNQQKMQMGEETLDNYGLAHTNGMIDDLNELSGKETQSLIAPSAFESLNIKTKRLALQQSHSCGKLDMSE